MSPTTHQVQGELCESAQAPPPSNDGRGSKVVAVEDGSVGEEVEEEAGPHSLHLLPLGGSGWVLHVQPVVVSLPPTSILVLLGT